MMNKSLKISRDSVSFLFPHKDVRYHGFLSNQKNNISLNIIEKGHQFYNKTAFVKDNVRI